MTLLLSIIRGARLAPLQFMGAKFKLTADTKSGFLSLRFP
jgi:hypothetical protein